MRGFVGYFYGSCSLDPSTPCGLGKLSPQSPLFIFFIGFP